MHRGNILVRRTHNPVLYFRMDHKEYKINSHGVLASVVDFTLSRINQGVNRETRLIIDNKTLVCVM